MKKYILLAAGAAVALAIILTLVSSMIPCLQAGQAAAQVSEEGTEAAAVTPAEEQAPYSIVAEAVVVPVQHATLSMPASGIVDEILVQEGETVEAGQAILRLQNAHQRAALASAQAALTSAEAAEASAQANLEALAAGARDQEIAAAQAGLEAAQARLARLEEGARQEEIAAARAGLEAAQATLQRLYDGPDQYTRIAAEADLANAEAALRQAQSAYDLVASREDIAMLPQSLQLEQATNGYEAAKARFNALFDEPDADVVANARAQVKQAQANLERLLEPVTANEIAEAEAGVRQAQAQFDLLLAGARDEELAAAAAAVEQAQAAVEQAQAAVEQAQASLADTELKAPFAGTIAALHVKAGEQVVAGMPVVQLADLSAWQVETDDLSELDIVRVTEGARVLLTFDAVEGLELPGTVMRIKPIGQEKLGDITYTVVVQPDEQDPRLRWNMTAVVTIPQE